ncbi:myosin-9 isoform X2 [Aplysia californica]|uniref:Myosin-9 isoform X2 n=1 Tax=Aplysia californica TaxID=6500 RepID=A0ABM0JPN0_APLCA|nr:myosin-9 isoform X2 [Aplysia californica]
MGIKGCLRLLSAIVFIGLIPGSRGQQSSVCTYTPVTSGSFSALYPEGTAIVDTAAVTGTLPNYTVDNAATSFSGTKISDPNTSTPVFDIDFFVQMDDSSASPDIVNITLTLTLVSLAGGPITDALLDIDLGTVFQAYWDVGVPASANLVGRSQVTYSTSALTAAGDSATITFLAEPTGAGGTNLPDGVTHLSVGVNFTAGGTNYEKISPTVCVERETNFVGSIVYEHGFTALVFFIMLFAGIGLAILGVFLFLCIRRRRRDASISPSKSDDKRIREKGKKIVMDAKAAMKRGNNAIKDFSLIDWNDSIVCILAMKDKLHMFREIDNLDILSTIHVDTDLETEQNDVSVQASLLLVQGLRHNGDITKAAEDRANTKFQNQLKELDRKLDADYKKELESVYTDVEAKNKEKMGDLLRKHKEQRQEAYRVVKDLSDVEKKQMMDLMDKQQQTEENELTYKLALQQNEEAEKLRKEFAIRKRMNIKELQSYYMDDVVKEGDLNAQKAEWLIKQHKEQQEEIHRMYDDEISRQRMNLEEKLARRKALAQASETQEDDHSDLLNAVAAIQLTLLTKLKKSGQLSSDQIDEYVKDARNEIGLVKDKLDKSKELKEEEMFKRMSQSKRKSLADQINKHAAELQEYISKNKSQQTEGPVDPLSYVNGLLTLKSKHRKELTMLENQIDEAHAKELETVRDQLAEGSKEELKTMERNLIEKLKSDGMQDEAINKILKTHDKTVSELTAKQLENRRNQELKLKDELARRKRAWDDRRAQEKKEQEELREHETVVVDKLLSSQLSFSEEERDRILKEHEKQMVKLENSLTLNKLRQTRMLEEKIAQRKAAQMEELSKKQNAELDKQRQIAENNGEEDDEETHRKELMLMKKHAEQRIALAQGQDLNIEDEMDEIRAEMTKERALALKGQEERLGAMITSLQMDKAREVAKIEEQQKAINNLKANLMDDLNARGILSTPEMEKILDIHKQEHEKLNQKLDGQRNKQEQMLRAKLQERLMQREKSMVERQDNEMRSILQKATNKASAKIRRMLLMHKHIVEMEKFKNKLDREINQSLENTKRDFDIQKQKIVQEQELHFIAGLVKVGKLSRNELTDVLHMLFPGKTEESISEMLNKIYEEDQNSKNISGAYARAITKHSGRSDLHSTVLEPCPVA